MPRESGPRRPDRLLRRDLLACRERKRVGDQLIGASTSSVIVRDRDDHHLLGAVLTRQRLDAAAYRGRGADDRTAA